MKKLKIIPDLINLSFNIYSVIYTKPIMSKYHVTSPNNMHIDKIY